MIHKLFIFKSLTMKRLLINIFLVATITNLSLSQTPQEIYIDTPTGISIQAIEYDHDYTVDYRMFLDSVWRATIEDSLWVTAVIKDTSSILYNCHGYAWHFSDGGTKIKIGSRGNVEQYFSTQGQNIPTYVLTSYTLGPYKKVWYPNLDGAHSAITTNDPELVKSKWGEGPLVEHARYDCPYNSECLEYYEVPQNGPISVSQYGSTTDTTLQISGASYSWSGDSYVCASGNYIATVIGLNQTTAPPNPIPTGKVKVEITSPYSNTTIKGLKEFSVTSSQITFPTITIDGDGNLVCSTGRSFRVNNLPAGWTIEWIDGLYLDRVSYQGSNPCTFSATGNGSSWVKAILHPSCGTVELPQYTVWAGKPVLYISGPYEGYVGNYYTFDANAGTYSNPTEYDDWILNPLLNNHIYDYGSYADFSFEDAYEGYQIVCRAKNSCSTEWGDWGVANISIYENEGFFLVAPNPASEFVTVSINNSSKSSIKQKNINAIYNIRVIDFFGNLYLSATKSGDSFTIPVYNLKDGNYIVQIQHDKKLSSLKLIVKH